MNKYDQRRERISEEVRLIVAGAPPERDELERYVNSRCRVLEDDGWAQADYREVEEQVRDRLNLPQW